MVLDPHLFLALVCAHLLGDFVFQTDWIARNKHRPPGFAAHIAVVGVATYVVPGLWGAWWLAGGVTVLHALVDLLKVRLGGRSPAAFWSDQAAHAGLLVLAAWVAPVWGAGGSWWMATFGVEAVSRVLFVAAGLAVTVWMGGIVVGIAVRPYLPVVERAGRNNDALAAPDRGLIKGGRLIGQLERGLIFFLVLIGRPESVAFLVAAKSVFRFGELKDTQNRLEAEYILIGTLMSFTWGLVAAWATRSMLGVV